MNRIVSRMFPAAALALLAAVQPSHAQQRGPGFMRNAVQVLADSAQSLGLSAGQATQLTAIAHDLDEQNRVPLDSLQRYRGQMGGMRMMGGEGMTDEQRAAMEHARPFMQQLRDNSRAAMEKAMAVLTPEQQEKARAMMPQRRGPGGPGGGAPPQP